MMNYFYFVSEVNIFHIVNSDPVYDNFRVKMHLSMFQSIVLVFDMGIFEEIIKESFHYNCFLPLNLLPLLF